MTQDIIGFMLEESNQIKVHLLDDKFVKFLFTEN